MNKGLTALAFGTFGLGVAEFCMMSILPDVAASFDISLPQAGHLISAYAFGVCVGAPLMVLVARAWKLRTILLSLMVLFVAGNLLMSVAPAYWVALVARFIAGMPHGAYFSTGVIVANRLAREGKSAMAVSTMVMGMTIANLLGVPMGSWLGHAVSWRVIFIIATVWGIVTMYAIRKWVPVLPALPKTNLKGQFRFLKKPEPWLVIIATMLGNAGIFCWYSYVNPFMVDISGFRPEHIPFLMLLAGSSMCVGNYYGGVFSDKYSPGTVAMFTQLVMTIALVLTFFLGRYFVVSALLMCVVTACLFAVSSPQQLLLMRYSPGGELMGGAMVQLAFNFGNALGAFLGGMPIESGAGVRYTAIIGAVITLLGMCCFAGFNYIRLKRKSSR